MTRHEPVNPAGHDHRLRRRLQPRRRPRPGAAEERVLIVDNDPDLLDLTSFAIESEGFSVVTATNGEEALGVLRAGELPRLVLLDLKMPVMNGWQFLDAIAKVPSFKVIPVVVLTATDPKTVPGALWVMRKPFDLGALIRIVAHYTRSP